MSSWAERAAATLLPLSRASSLGPALREWSYTGRFFDLEARDGICELCGQQDLRYHFEIENSRSEEHTSELQSLMRISYAVFCLKKKKQSKTLSQTCTSGTIHQT